MKTRGIFKAVILLVGIVLSNALIGCATTAKVSEPQKIGKYYYGINGTFDDCQNFIFSKNKKLNKEEFYISVSTKNTKDGKPYGYSPEWEDYDFVVKNYGNPKTFSAKVFNGKWYDCTYYEFKQENKVGEWYE